MQTTYEEYLESPEWKELRSKVYLRSSNMCELCGRKAEAVHHIRYPKKFKEDEMSNLLAVCDRCHKKLHAIKPDIDDENNFYSNETSCNYDFIVRCPECGNTNIHIYKYALNKGGNIRIFDASGERFLDGEPVGRGVSIWLHFYGECGHTWYNHYQFHKGLTYLDVVTDKLSCWPEDLWRD